MSLIDFKKIQVGNFKGLFDRGDPDMIPGNHLYDILNVKFGNTNLFTREGLSKVLHNHNFKRFFIYNHNGTRELVSVDLSGHIYSEDNLISQHIIASYGEAFDDIYLLNFYNKAFICPNMQSINSGLTQYWQDPGSADALLYGPPVQLWDGTFIDADGNFSLRSIGAMPPHVSEGTIAFSDAATGNPGLDAGVHRIAVAYETISGYITYPGPINYIPTAPSYIGRSRAQRRTISFFSHSCPGAKDLDVVGIPTRSFGDGRTEIIKRRFMLATRANETEYFFVPDTRVTPNLQDITTTSATLSFEDTDLVASADYLFNMRVQQPCAIGAIFYKGRLVLWSGKTAIPGGLFSDADQTGSTLLVSMAGQPEAFDGTTGFVVVNPDDGYYITTCFQLRDTLYVCKSIGAYATQDNGQEPATWDVALIDSGVSIPLFGVASFVSSHAADAVIVADKSGLLLFDGTFRRPELTWKIESLWKRITKTETAWNTVQLCVNPFKKEIYCAVPLDGAEAPTHIIYGDFSQCGAFPEHEEIRWSVFRFDNAYPNCIGILDLVGDLEPKLRFGSSTDYLYTLDQSSTRDDNQPIESYIQTYFANLRRGRTGYDGMLHYYNHLKSRVSGNGNLKISLYGLDGANASNSRAWELQLNSGRDLQRWINFKNEKMSVKLYMNQFDEHFDLSRLDIYCNPIFDSRPSGEY